MTQSYFGNPHRCSSSTRPTAATTAHWPWFEFKVSSQWSSNRRRKKCYHSIRCRSFSWVFAKSQLQVLDLSYHRPGRTGVVALAQALPDSKLQSLTLRDSGLSADCLEALAKALFDGAPLKRLSLPDNVKRTSGRQGIAFSPGLRGGVKALMKPCQKSAGQLRFVRQPIYSVKSWFHLLKRCPKASWPICTWHQNHWPLHTVTEVCVLQPLEHLQQQFPRANWQNWRWTGKACFVLEARKLLKTLCHLKAASNLWHLLPTAWKKSKLWRRFYPKASSSSLFYWQIGSIRCMRLMVRFCLWACRILALRHWMWGGKPLVGLNLRIWSFSNLC